MTVCVAVATGFIGAHVTRLAELGSDDVPPNPLDRTLQDTIGWYRDVTEGGMLGGVSLSPLSPAAAGVRLADRTGPLSGLRAAERYAGRRLVARG